MWSVFLILMISLQANLAPDFMGGKSLTFCIVVGKLVFSHDYDSQNTALMWNEGTRG